MYLHSLLMQKKSQPRNIRFSAAFWEGFKERYTRDGNPALRQHQKLRPWTCKYPWMCKYATIATNCIESRSSKVAARAALATQVCSS